MRQRGAWAIVLALSAPARALAQETPAAPPETAVEPPTLVHDPGVAYPAVAAAAGVRETVRVVLILELDEHGSVTQVTPEKPADPRFDDAAIAAARKLVFTPARRGGAAVRARIRYVYTFVPPPEPAPAPAEPPAAAPAETFRIFGHRLSREELERRLDEAFDRLVRDALEAEPEVDEVLERSRRAMRPAGVRHD